MFFAWKVILVPGPVPGIETPHSRADEESDSVKDFFIVLFAYPEAKPSGNALTGIQLPVVHPTNETTYDDTCTDRAL